MNIVKPYVTKNNTIKSLPITNNYLTEIEGEFHWKYPNDDWSLFSSTANYRQMITNVQADETEHSPDLFLYKGLPQLHDDAFDLKLAMQQNELCIQEHDKAWYIRQFMVMDRVGIKRFTGIPLIYFHKVWRTPIPPQEVTITKLKNSMVKFTWNDISFNVYFNWPELQYEESDIVFNPRLKVQNKLAGNRHSATTLPWLQKHCQGGVYFFSDYTSMFENADDEFLYVADLC